MKKILVAAALAGSLSAAAFGDAHAADKPAADSGGAVVIVARATTACFSDMVRVTGFLVPRREAQIGVDQEGFKITDVLVREGDQVNENQELLRLVGPPAPAGPNAGRPTPLTLRAPSAGLVIGIMPLVKAGVMASPQMGALVRLFIGNDIELDAEVPSIHVMKLNPGATARVSTDDGSEAGGRVRVVEPEIDRRTQLGKVRISVQRNPSIKVGMFARAAIDANRSCGVSVPRSAIDHSAVQVVKDNIVETRRVQVGLVSDTTIEIRDGVKEGEIVVANAGTSLHDGDKIKTIFADEVERVRGR